MSRHAEAAGSHPVTTSVAPWTGPLPGLADVVRAGSEIRPFLPPTPVIRSEALSERLGCNVIVKCENLQPTGAFKVRGGVNLLRSLDPELRAQGVVAASTGNHGQSIAYAAREFGTSATIVVPENPNLRKVQAMERLGAEVRVAGRDIEEAIAAAAELARSNGAYFVHSADVLELIAGVGTYALEMMEQAPELDALFIPVGGGSGLAGACISAKAVKPELMVCGVQAEGASAGYASWKARRFMEIESAETFAEGIAVRSTFALPSAIIWEQADDIMLVSDAELQRALLTMLETTGMLAEGAGAASLAAAYKRREELQGKNVGVVISGGNLTLDALKQAMNEERAW